MEAVAENRAIDLVHRLTDEGLISVKEAATLYGRRFHKSTVTRHITNGVKLPTGETIRLEAIRVGGSFCTSKPAVLRFFAAQNVGVPAPSDPAPTPAVRKRAAAAASEELEILLHGNG